ncbi:hypothetical protein DPMN_193361 [Dreissena polymorpha]|uniref:Uncharacterized protein n=1 Tax=Dreissena polymorpha TaxID=45954 RepID=A0A9D3Y4E8_DREPO|nr:hypothetical protein DPMN_193361 [Dreissena polymorpha]
MERVPTPKLPPQTREFSTATVVKWCQSHTGIRFTLFESNFSSSVEIRDKSRNALSVGSDSFCLSDSSGTICRFTALLLSNINSGMEVELAKAPL